MDTVDTQDLANQARALVRRERHAVLSTISVHRPGYPYGSLTPYALSRRGAPVILISTLAAHTTNLVADPRASLFLGTLPAGADDAADLQAGSRVSLLGRFARVSAADDADLRARYAARLPRAAVHAQTNDFRLWEMAVEEVRLIAGFGQIGWLDGATVLGDPDQ